MADAIISVRVDQEIHHEMKVHDEINWSAIIRKAVTQTLDHLSSVDQHKALKAAHEIDWLRKAGTFSKGKKSTEVIREWREKRKL